LTTKMLASTVQFSNNKHTHTTPNPPTPETLAGMGIRHEPATEKTPRETSRLVVLSGPNRMSSSSDTKPTHEHPVPHPERQY
jgi:hypothetical protein